MHFMPIVPQADMQDQSRTAAVFAGPLPRFYMNDYSVMGLRVNDCAATFRLLAAHRYDVSERRGCRGVAIQAAAEIPEIIDLLARNGVSGEVTDVAEQIYQG